MFEKLPLILATRLAAGLIAVASAASAQANVIVTFNTATATDHGRLHRSPFRLYRDRRALDNSPRLTGACAAAGFR